MSEPKISGYCEKGTHHQTAPKAGCSTSWCECDCHKPFRAADELAAVSRDLGLYDQTDGTTP